MQYAVLIDTGVDWPDVIFAGDYDDARSVFTQLPAHYASSLQAVVSLADALATVTEGDS